MISKKQNSALPYYILCTLCYTKFFFESIDSVKCSIIVPYRLHDFNKVETVLLRTNKKYLTSCNPKQIPFLPPLTLSLRRVAQLPRVAIWPLKRPDEPNLAFSKTAWLLFGFFIIKDLAFFSTAYGQIWPFKNFFWLGNPATLIFANYPRNTNRYFPPTIRCVHQLHFIRHLNNATFLVPPPISSIDELQEKKDKSQFCLKLKSSCHNLFMCMSYALHCVFNELTLIVASKVSSLTKLNIIEIWKRGIRTENILIEDLMF